MTAKDAKETNTATAQKNGSAGGGLIKRLRRSASATEHNLSNLRNRKSTQNLFDQHGNPIDLQQYRKVLDKDENGNGTSEKKARYRRTQSVTRAEEISNKEAKQRKAQPDRSIHRPRDSLFSWSSGFTNFTGLVNWGFLLLCIGGLRLGLENLLKYGIRINPLDWFFFLSGRNQGEGHNALFLVLYSLVHISLCLAVEKGLALEIISEGLGMFIQVTNIVVSVCLPVVIIHLKGAAFSLSKYLFLQSTICNNSKAYLLSVGASTVCFFYSVLFLKLWSYVQTNMWCRQKYYQRQPRERRPSITLAELKNGHLDAGEDDEHLTKLVQYPENLSYKDILYFLCAPTLCYELNFPRTSRVRKRFLLKRMLEVLIGVNVVMALFQQWIIPSVRNSLIPFSNMDVGLATERLLKLALPNHLVWLCFFYLMFHSFLNAVGEVLNFADRNFYCDWWNANNIDTFWRTWNMPVHRWCVRHLYIPVVQMGYSSRQASTIVFLFSAFFHEYLVSVPLQTYKIWAFLGMMGQIPLSAISKYIERRLGPRMGNIIVWASIILGQPLCIMAYYHDYVVTHFQNSLNGTEYQ
ncbi:diacylglycerol O-acyltransferase 1 isoform X2 [Drosophila busckii]|uniref:diacylglycerol O-acyltransferase 1 isoform X2 n=1 Tax=Drosophila busckii TaxID=30019 RepID=UPI00083F0C1A|nr:diacylglycerol O-acyltransferase 1 isoform X2 [Drosophila busckii]XP_017854491.1 diacylglycerol O-acyltransferase 1 isoform X2 [Drosophila busckii]